MPTPTPTSQVTFCHTLIEMERHPLLRDPGSFKEISIKKGLVATNTNGRAVYSLAGPPTSDCVKALQGHLRIDDAIGHAAPGYYTWIMKDVSGSVHSIAAPTYSKQEIGTLHMNLDRFTVHGPVLIAGELHISPERIYTYNILSGTYTAKLTKDLQSERLPLFMEALDSYGVPKETIRIQPFAEILTTVNPILPEYMKKLYLEVCGMKRTSQAGGRRKTRRRGRGSL